MLNSKNKMSRNMDTVLCINTKYAIHTACSETFPAHVKEFIFNGVKRCK